VGSRRGPSACFFSVLPPPWKSRPSGRRPPHPSSHLPFRANSRSRLCGDGRPRPSRPSKARLRLRCAPKRVSPSPTQIPVPWKRQGDARLSPRDGDATGQETWHLRMNTNQMIFATSSALVLSMGSRRGFSAWSLSVLPQRGSSAVEEPAFRPAPTPLTFVISSEAKNLPLSRSRLCGDGRPRPSRPSKARLRLRRAPKSTPPSPTQVPISWKSPRPP